AEGLPERFKVVIEPRLLRLGLRDGAFVWIEKVLGKLGRLVGLEPKRRVPVRLAARASSDERLATALVNIVPAWFEARGEMLDELAKLINGESDAEAVKHAVVRRATQFTERVAADLDEAVSAVIDD